ncbi:MULTISPECIES: hypothetical protein [unclassified Ensifer]|uniref:hypothetical protein n=1 Tax=unclassified Ensifer TaxID=2633371 RepID=UPI00070CA25C|nr:MULTISPECIES: hypothetical protein [unclassified Ensifer]KQW61063.1 hypothetical protein ASD02_23315 [Ensifer sp. Root1252]KRC77968.1 hypothetical protein ASE32_27925 [Ensifer sp. Root231]KRD00389.1 hypothetical protein ASE47_23885 [Ensifer sp. Root258]
MATKRLDRAHDQLSLRDLLDARDQYHIHLMRHANVIATAIGLYRIRTKDSWPTERSEGKVHGTYARTLANSQVRYYSWPAILVFVERWVTEKELEPGDLVPKTLYLPDGRSVPVCVIEAPKESRNETRPLSTVFPVNNIGGGWPVIARNQGQEYAATIACLVSDGHTVYALTNRHVAGEAGEIIYSRLGGKEQRIGVSSEKHLTRALFTTHYPGWPGRDVYVNLDVGLIDIDNLDRWTAEIRHVGQMGKMVDLSVHTISLALIGRDVRGTGAASGEMEGEIAALFYRYKTNGGFEYVADLLIGPRPAEANKAKEPTFATHPGDSGTLWLLEPDDEGKSPKSKAKHKDYQPLAMQWGRNMLYSAGEARPQSYVLATLLSRVCAELGVDPVRNWNLDQPDTWSAIGHFSIANRAQVALSNRSPKLNTLMKNNADIISHDDATILAGEFSGMGSADFVALADVPDFYWKPRIAKQGFARTFEGPNHFADMDQPDPNGKTLLELCRDDPKTFIDPRKWAAFYDSVTDLESGDAIAEKYRGLLPFRVWQTFDAMVEFAAADKPREFVCAAGTLTHYIGDACQPLHISYLHDGDPLRLVEYTFTRGERKGQTEMRRFGKGVHGGYEDTMISAFREKVLAGLLSTPKTEAEEMITTGFEAAKLTVEMMRKTFTSIPPMAVVNEFGSFLGKPKERAEHLWRKFGNKTVKNMQSGAHLLAVLWESAWAVGNGDTNVTSTAGLTKDQAMAICADFDFIPSVSISRIGALLKPPMI